MTDEQLIALLRDRLSISISVDEAWDYGESSKRATVTLLLDGETISTDSCSFDVSRG